MRVVKSAWLVLAASLLLAACGEDHEVFPTAGIDVVDSDADSEAFGTVIYVFLAVNVDEAGAQQLTAEIAEVAPGAEIEFEPAQREFVVASDATFDCPLWDGPSLQIAAGEDDGGLSELIDLLETHDLVVAVDAPELGIFLDGEEPFIECDSRRVSVLFDPAVGFDPATMVGTAFGLEGVVAVSTGSLSGSGDIFVPDFAEYPQAQECYAPVFEDLTIYLARRDESVSQSIVDGFKGVPGVEGFSGWDIDESLDPVLAWENEHYGEEGDAWFRECEGLEAYVSLDPMIDDSAAALVASRAAAIPGVADVDLRLVDPDYVQEGCESRGTGGLMLGIGLHASSFIDCSAVTSELTIYRGDKLLATPTAISEALCELPGVLHIAVYDHEMDQEFADPYQTCGSLHLDVLLDSSLIGDENDTDLDPLFVALNDSQVVSSYDGPFFADYEVFEQTVVFGAVDELLCLNAAETIPRIAVELVRTTREEAEMLAAELGSLDGVIRVTGNAVGIQGWSPEVCGYDGLSLHLVRDGGKQEVAEILAELEGRNDVLAVVVEEETPFIEGDRPEGSWVLVKFNTATPPDDLDELVDRIGALEGVLEAEAWRWAWDEEWLP